MQFRRQRLLGPGTRASVLLTGAIVSAFALAWPGYAIAQRRPVIVSSEFVAEAPPTPSAHASTIVETPTGLIAAWFGGSREGARDVGIWLSRQTRGAWTQPVEVANGAQSDGSRYACYNPVLVSLPDRTLRLFYKVGPQPARWWGMVQTSRDDGITWSPAERLPAGILGPIKNKPVLLGGTRGVLVSPSSTESIDDPPTWRVHFEISHDLGGTWRVVAPLPGVDDRGTTIEAIQPGIVAHTNGTLQALGRTRSGRVFETWSMDSGGTWQPLRLTTLPNPNAGVDAIALRDGRALLVYNNSASARTPLSVALSTDGSRWETVLALEDGPGEYSYPAVIQTQDGLVHITYTWRRERIKHVVLDPRP